MDTTRTASLATDLPTRLEQAIDDLQTARYFLRLQDRASARDALILCRGELPRGSRARDLAQRILNELRLGIRPTYLSTALLREYIEDLYDEAIADQD